MFEDKRRSYYMRDKFLNLWIFTHTSYDKVVYEVYNNQNKKIHHAILATECSEDFLVNIGEKNDIHMVLKKNSGDLYYYFFSGQKWNILKLFNIGQYKGLFQLLSLQVLKNEPHILYGIKSTTESVNWLLIDLSWEKKKWSHVKFFQTTISPSQFDYTCTHDSFGNLYFVCQWWDGKEHHLQFCQFHSKVKLWNKNILTFSKGDHYAPNIYITENQKIHVCWFSIYKENYCLRYRQKNISSSEGTQWEKEKQIYLSKFQIHRPFFSRFQNKLTVFWIEDKKLFYLQSEDAGESWDTSPKILVEISHPEYILFLSQEFENKDNSSYIIMEKESSQTYPLSLFSQKEADLQITSNNNIFYPSSPSQNRSSNIQPNKVDSEGSNSTGKVPYPSNRRKTQKNTPIQNLTKEKIKSESERKPRSTKNIYPASFDQRNKFDEKKEVKEHLRTKIIENENLRLKSNVSEYHTLLEDMKKDLQELKKQISILSIENKTLQKDVHTLRENTISRKIYKIFKSE